MTYKDGQAFGIAALGLAVPSLSLSAEELARTYGTAPDKYLTGLGIQRIALCAPDENAMTLGMRAAQRAVRGWGGDLGQIGMVVVGTESGPDFSKPLSQSICRDLGLGGAVRSYEVKHACLGGSLAIRQAVEWMASGAAQGQVALIVATDVCQYAPGSASEPTQGAGAVAFVIGPPLICGISLETYSYSSPIDDFYRPIGNPYPIVDDRASHRSYFNAAKSVFQQWREAREGAYLDELSAMAFHCPFPKMVLKSVSQILKYLDYAREDAAALIEDKVAQYLEWNRVIGNAYTASLWFTVANVLAHPARKPGSISAFSYGSGCGAELMFLHPAAEVTPYWAEGLREDLENATMISAKDYASLRQRSDAQ